MYKEILKSELKKVIASLGAENDKFTVGRPADEKFGDYATNVAMLLTKELKKGPLDIAKEIAHKFPKLEFIERVEIEHPGFVNFHLKNEALIDNLNEIINKGSDYGRHTVENSEKIVLEHTAVNPNKALHIGHIRSACLGSACEKILKFLGHSVEVQYYVDDTGVQVAVSALGALEMDVDPKPNEKFDHFAGRAYVEAMKALEDNPKLEKKKEDLIKELDQQEGKNLRFIKEFVTNVINANLETANKFGIDYDVLVWESDIILGKFWDKAFEILKKCPNFYLAKTGKNKDCWVMKGLAENEKVIVKSNGVVTYTGKDIAYHLWKYNLLNNGFKFEKWPTEPSKRSLYTTSQKGKSNNNFGHADSVVNFIDIRQTFPQQIVKNALEILGFKKEAKNFKHIAYGVVSLNPKTARELGIETEEGKQQYAMSGRAGMVVLADDLLKLIMKKLKQKHREAPEPEKISAAAIKYLMLSHNTYSDIVFSYDKALDIYGNTGPYLQYAYARSRSVLRKAKNKAEFDQKYLELRLSEQEISLLKWLIHFRETIMEAGKQYAPNLLCNYLFELSSRFNTFYNKRPILKSKKGPVSSEFRLLLTAATAQILEIGLNLIGLDRLEKM